MIQVERRPQKLICIMIMISKLIGTVHLEHNMAFNLYMYSVTIYMYMIDDIVVRSNIQIVGLSNSCRSICTKFKL